MYNFYFSKGPLSTALADRFTCRVALVTSGVLYIVGFLGTAFAPNIEVCVFTCGIIAGKQFHTGSFYVTG